MLALAASDDPNPFVLVWAVVGGGLVSVVLVWWVRRHDRADTGADRAVIRAARRALDTGRLPDDPAVRDAARALLPRAGRQLAALRRWTTAACAAGFLVLLVFGVVLAVRHRPVALALSPVGALPLLAARLGFAELRRRHDEIAAALD